MPSSARPATGPGAAPAAGPARQGRPASATYRVRAYVGLGANLGDAEETLVAAVHALAALPDVALVGVSRLYATAPVGVTDQPGFLNAAVAIDAPTGLDPASGAVALLVALKTLERAFGRGTRRHWGPRELDLDLLVFGDATLSMERPPGGLAIDPGHAGRFLDVPHPSAPDRLFVLAPLADLAPDLVPPGWPETVGQARDRRLAVEGADAARSVAPWSQPAGRWARRGRGARRGPGRTGGADGTARNPAGSPSGEPAEDAPGPAG